MFVYRAFAMPCLPKKQQQSQRLVTTKLNTAKTLMWPSVRLRLNWLSMGYTIIQIFSIVPKVAHSEFGLPEHNTKPRHNIVMAI